MVDQPEISEGFRSFTQDTTLHGARFLFANNIFRRLIWIAAITGCLVYCSYQVCTCVIEFNKRPFNTKITTNASTDNSELFFPAVTLCNLNSFNTRRYRQMLSGPYNKNILERKIRDISLMISGSKEILSKEFKARNPELFQRQTTAGGTNKNRVLFGHQIEDMLLPSTAYLSSCAINGMRCDAKNFTNYLSYLHGNCYTFNSAENGGNPLLRATIAGRNSGLKLRLNIERDGYLANTLQPSLGLVVLIHDQETSPTVEEFGITVQPGISTTCAIKRRKIINLKKPYAANCKSGSLDVFNTDSHIAYTKQACLIKCRNDYTIKTCGCTPPKFKADPLVPVCAPNDTVLCVYRTHEEFGASSEKNKCEEECREACSYVEYKTSFSYSGLQREALIEHLMSFLDSTEKSSVDRAIYEPLLNMTKAEREKYIDDNIISLDIYFEDLSVDIIEQTPLYEIWALIGDLGGTFGLFLGMSCLTVFEFLDFALRKMFYLFKEKRSTRTIDAEN